MYIWKHVKGSDLYIVVFDCSRAHVSKKVLFMQCSSKRRRGRTEDCTLRVMPSASSC